MRDEPEAIVPLDPNRPIPVKRPDETDAKPGKRADPDDSSMTPSDQGEA